ncbi:Small-subunit processome, Utp13 domain-containing protein [Rozella allomycis CSF55]|uniref:Small-subunit processome, Utp13 domain-containing protein n=1 Tax=Rozella allomycis (strain CSF55) TaxID=988480 RepID=A0A075B3N7_ROZAC|nr:Small-subunit processome, Utp13 domain-containing protein [Rozella allomycis CSF55]|eukprot:EPZ35626.1 Small-subunit processome, Utp13 domain-containing protein [Rozella allomycis CSF55]
MKIQIKSSILEPIYSGGPVTLSTDFRYILSTLNDEVKVTDILNGNSLFSLPGDDEPVTCICSSPDGRVIVTSSRSLMLTIWDASNGKAIRSFKSPVLSMAVDPTSKYLATGSADTTIRVWDLEKGFCTHNFKGHGGAVTSIIFHDDRDRWELYSGSADGKIKTWDLISKESTSTLSGHVSPVTSLAISSCGHYLISSCRDQTIGTWDLRRKNLINNFPVYEAIEKVVVVSGKIFGKPSDSSIIITAGEKGLIRAWDFQTGELKGDTEEVVVVTEDHNLHFYKLPLLEESIKIIGFNDEITDLKLLNENELAISTNSELVKILNLNDFGYKMLSGHEDIVLCLTSRNGLLASGSKDKSVRIWNNYKGDITYLLSASQDRTVKRWDIKSKSAIYTIQAHDKDINAIDVAPNDKCFATGSQDKTAKLWNSEDGSLIGTFKGHKRGIWSLKFSTFDKCLVTASADKTIKLWSVGDFTCLKTFEGHVNSVLKVLFINQGTQLVSSGSNGLIKVWSIKSNECVATLDNHEDKVWALETINDGDKFISGGADSTITFWNDVTKEEEDEKDEKEREFLLQEQELNNATLHKDYKKAFQIALRLEQPFKMFKLLQSILEKESLDSLQPIIKDLTLDQLETFLGYVKDWCTHSKRILLAQSLLNIVFKTFHPNTILEIKSIRDIMTALLAYTEKYYDRVDDLVIKNKTIDHVLCSMNSLYLNK